MTATEEVGSLKYIFKHHFTVCCLALVVAGIGGGIVGRYLEAAQDIEEKTETITNTVYVTKTLIHREEAKTRVVIRDRVVTPDGTVKEHVEEREETKTVEKTDTGTDTKVDSKVLTEHHETTYRPQWRLGLLGGAKVSLSPPGASLVFGAIAERRLVGPFFVGAWGLSNGSVGASLSVEF